MHDFPMVRLTIDHMRHEIVQAFARHGAGIQSQVEAAVDAAVRDFDFDAEVRHLAGQLLRDQVRKSLEYAFRKLAWDDAMCKALVRHMLAEMAKGDQYGNPIGPEERP
jgi:hypothetical protein